MEIVMNKLAYCKIVLHLAKYPYLACNGLLLSKKQEENNQNSCLTIVDSLPLFHSSSPINITLEIALSQVNISK